MVLHSKKPDHDDVLGDDYIEEYLIDDNNTKKSLLFRRVFYAIIVCGVCIGGAIYAVYSYRFSQLPRDPSQLELIMVEKEPFKEKPAEPGGMQVPNMDKTVYDRIAGKNNELPKVERILPAPEEPMEREKLTDTQTSVDISPNMAEEHDTMPTETSVVTTTDYETDGLQDVPHERVTIDAIDPAMKKTHDKEALKPLSEHDLKRVEKKATVAKDVKNTAGGLRIQLGAFKSEKEAMDEWHKLQAKFSEPLGSLHAVIEKANLGDKGVFFRLQATPVASEAEGRKVCAKLIEQKQGCFFVK